MTCHSSRAYARLYSTGAHFYHTIIRMARGSGGLVCQSVAVAGHHRQNDADLHCGNEQQVRTLRSFRERHRFGCCASSPASSISCRSSPSTLSTMCVCRQATSFPCTPKLSGHCSAFPLCALLTCQPANLPALLPSCQQFMPWACRANLPSLRAGEEQGRRRRTSRSLFECICRLDVALLQYAPSNGHV